MDFICKRNISGGKVKETGCSIFGGPGGCEIYICPESRPDLWENHLQQHKLLEKIE